LKAYKIAYLGSDSEVSLALSGALKAAGMDFMSASGDYQGIRKAVDFNSDLLLWDLDSGDTGQPAPIEEIRKQGAARQGVVVIAREGDVEAAVKSLSAGAIDFIFMPVEEDEVAPRIIASLNTGQQKKRADYYRQVIEDTNNQVRGILSNLTDPAYIVSPQYQILYMNRAAEEIFGEGLRGGACHSVFYDRGDPCEVCQKSKGPTRWRSTLKNGKSYRFISALIRNPRGEVEKLAVGTDITPDEEVRKIHRTFISNVSHDLRTPLAAIDQYVSIMLDGLGGELTDEQKNFLDVIKRSSFRLHNLIENLIDANNILSGHFKLKMEVTTVNEILEIILGRLESQAGGKGITLQVQIPDDVPQVYADKSRIAQVIANIAGNSIKFTEQGMIQIRAGFMPRDEGRVIVSVEDTGIGIPKEDLGKIFDLFYRVEKGEVYVEEGAGMGLAISRDIVRAHGGTLWAESMEGMGSAFHFTLPSYKAGQQMQQEKMGPRERGLG